MRLVLPEAQLKSVQTAAGTRTLDFYAATFDTDKHGDVIAPTAFDDWLKGLYETGDSLPISFAHAAILNSTDAAQIIGYAPADMAHVWADQFGLRVKSVLYADLSTAKHVIRLIDDKVVKAASLALQVKDWEPLPGGKRLITKAGVREAGPAMFPVNDKAVLLALKSSLDEGWLSAEQFQDLFGLDAEGHMKLVKAEELDDLLVKSAPDYVQATHDSSVRAGAVCEHEEIKAEQVDEAVDESKPDADAEDLSEEQKDALVKAEQVLEEATPLLSDEDREIQRRFRYLEITNGK
jgi:HK97 family phage prohead protease